MSTATAITTPGEPFIDLNGNNTYDGPGKNPPEAGYEQLWQQLTASGQLQTGVGFDYTNGHGEPIRSEAFTGTAVGGVRNLESQGRQLYARQLYCLMLLLVDMNYVAPWETIDTDSTTGAGNDRARAQDVDGYQAQ